MSKARHRAAAASLLLILSALAAGAGASVVSAGGLACTINGTPGNDYWDTVPSGSVVCGGAGDDTIAFIDGYGITFYGGQGNDTIFDWIGADVVFEGGLGDDYVGHFHDFGLYGVFYGGQGADRVDSCHAGTFYGGNGTDTATVVTECTVNLGRQ